MFTSANIATARCGQKGKEIFGNQDNVLRGQVESYIHIVGAELINIMLSRIIQPPLNINFGKLMPTNVRKIL